MGQISNDNPLLSTSHIRYSKIFLMENTHKTCLQKVEMSTNFNKYISTKSNRVTGYIFSRK